METTEKMFKPQVVGVDKKRMKEALNAWSLYIDSLNDAAGDICAFLDVDKISYEKLVELLNDGPDKILVSLHRIKNDYPKTMDLEKMVNLGLLTNFYSECIQTDVKEYKKVKSRAEEYFNKYDVSLLMNDDGICEINKDLETALTEAFTRFTKNEEENNALTSMKLIINGLNYFIPSKVRVAFGTTGINPIIKMIKVSDDRTKFELNHYLFMRD